MYFTDIAEPRPGDYDRAGRLSDEVLLQIPKNTGTRRTMAVNR